MGKATLGGKKKGLSKAILNVVEDKNHDIWISTVTSIYKIKVDRRADKYSFHVISCLSEDEIRQDDLYSFPFVNDQGQSAFPGADERLYRFLTRKT